MRACTDYNEVDGGKVDQVINRLLVQSDGVYQRRTNIDAVLITNKDLDSTRRKERRDFNEAGHRES